MNNGELDHSDHKALSAIGRSLARLIHFVFHDLVLSDIREFLFVLIDETGSRY